MEARQAPGSRSSRMWRCGSMVMGFLGFACGCFMLGKSCKNSTLPKFNSSPLKSCLPNRKIVIQPSFFRGYVKLPGGIPNVGLMMISHGHVGWFHAICLIILGKDVKYIPNLLSGAGIVSCILLFPKDVLRKGFPVQSYSGDGIETINPTLGTGLDSWGNTSTSIPLESFNLTSAETNRQKSKQTSSQILGKTYIDLQKVDWQLRYILPTINSTCVCFFSRRIYPSLAMDTRWAPSSFK